MLRLRVDNGGNGISHSNKQPASTRKHTFMSLLVIVGLFEIGYLLLVALAPLPGLHLFDTPLSSAWPWLLTISNHFSSLFTQNAWLSQYLLAALLLALLILYSSAIGITIRRFQQIVPTRNWLWFFVGSAVLFGLTLLLEPKLFSDDVFTYIFSGRILAIYRANPLNTAPIQYPFDIYLRWVITGRNAPNIYGPLWLSIAALLVNLHGNPVVTLLLFKGLAVLTHVLNCLLVWAILSKIAPARQLQGTLLYAWNPLVLIELAGSGHSDGLLMSLLLFTVWLYLRRGSRWQHTLVLLTLGLAVSMNLVVLLLVPLYLWFEVRTLLNRHKPHQIMLILMGRACIVLLPALAISLPFWRGATTFFALTSAMDMQHFVHSPTGVLALPFRTLFTSVAQLFHLPSFLQPIISADATLRASATIVFILIYIDQFGHVRRAPSTIAGMRYSPDADPQMTVPGFDTLLTAWCMSLFWYTILVSGWFWPWYLLWILWAFTLRRLDAFTSTFLVLSGTVLFFYPFLAQNHTSFVSYQTALIFAIPLVYLIVVKTKEQREKAARYHDMPDAANIPNVAHNPGDQKGNQP